MSGGDAHAIEAVGMFCAMLGTVAGNLALTLGARGGVYIAGGIVPRFLDFFAQSRFRARFVEKVASTRLWAQTTPGTFEPLKVTKGVDRLRAPLPGSGSVAARRIRPSAGTRSPASMLTMSPGTSCSIGTSRNDSPWWRDDSGSVRATTKHQCDTCASDVHTFWPFTTHSSPSRCARVATLARAEPALGSL